VGADLWWVDAKRLQPKMRKTFYQTKRNIFDKHFPRGVVSDEIFSDTLENLEKLAKGRGFKRCHVDLEKFRNVGPFINWQELLNNAPRGEE
jgi:hypothetical protein